MKNSFFKYLFCFLLGVKSYAQQPVFTHLTEKDGLPDIEFYNILEDKEGFIWLAADKGLFRYDGKEFKNYTHPDKRGLSVFGLKLDSKGRVWCNNITGQFFVIENDKLTLFADYKTEVGGQLASFVFYKNDLVISCRLGIFKTNSIQPNKNRTHITHTSFNFINANDESLFFFEENKLYSFLDKKVKLYDFGNYEKYKFNKWHISFFRNKVLLYTYATDSRNTESKVFYEIGGELKNIEFLNKKDKNLVINFYEVNNDLWVFTHDGVIVYQYKENEFVYKKTLFKGKEVTSFLKDRNNNYWFTTLRDGVYIVPNIYIEKYELEEEKSNISAMGKLDQNMLMFGTTKGDIGLIKNRENELNFLKKQNNEKVFSICNNEKDVYLSLWYSSFRYNKDSKELNYEEFCNNAKDLTLVSEDKILYASHSNATLINLKDKTSSILKNKRSYSTYYSKSKEEIYVGYVDGVEKYDKDLKSDTILFNNKPIFAIDIDETSDGMIWISTFKEGVIGIKGGQVVVNLREESGLLSNRTGKIKGDENVLWITTSKGIQTFNTITREFKNITKKDGINSFNISEIIPFEENVFLSSNKGLYKIDKRNVFKPRKLHDFYFTQVLVDDEKVRIKNEYKLEANTKKLQFNFHTNGFLAEDNIVYKYRLKGASEEWNLVSRGVNELTFNSLAGGKYIFQLKAVEVNGENETSIKNVKININIPFYKKWWFIVSSFLGLLALLWFYFINRIKRLRYKQEQILEKERMQKQLVSSKLESLQAQMNPHFTFNALNSIQNLVLKGDKLEAYDYLTKFSLLIRENLNMSRKSFVSFQEEIQLLKKYLELEKLRFREEFVYEIIGEENIEDILIPTMIIQPYVENAIKHGLLHRKELGKKVRLEFFQEEEVLKCVVIDNGIGVKASKKIKKESGIIRESFSTKAIKERLVMLRKYYKTNIGVVYEEVNEGTKVIIKLPYTKK